MWLLLAAIGLGSVLWHYYPDGTSRNAIGRFEPVVRSEPPAPAERSEGDDAAPERETRAEPRQGNAAQIVSDLRRRLELARAERDRALEELAAFRAREAVEGVRPSFQIRPETPDPGLSSPPTIIGSQAVPEQPPGAVKPVADQPASSTAKGLAGTWFYAPTNTDSNSEGLYPAEYIELILTERAGSISGRYRARYRISDQALSPEVIFLFEGSASDVEAHFLWTGAANSRGEVRLKLLSSNSMEVNWWTTELGTWRGLASGTAVLTRRRDP